MKSAKNILIVVDYQNDFVNGSLKNDAAVKLEKGIEKEVEQALANGNIVLFTLDTHEQDYLNTREGTFLPVEHCINGTDGHKLYGTLAKYEANIHENVHLLNKPTFGSNKICAKVQEICGGEPSEITICGVVTDICVISNAIILHSNFLNSKITLKSNLCAAVTQEGHNRALDVLRGMGYNVV